MKPSKNSNNDANKSMVFMGMGFELVIMVLAGAYLGQFIDNYYGWQGYSTAVLILAFLGTWFYHLLFMLKKINGDDGNEPSDGL